MTVLLAILGFGRSFFGAVFSWLSKRSLAEIGCIVLGLVALVAILNGRAEKRHSAKVEAQLIKCADARRDDRVAYVKAQADAAAKNKAHVQDIEHQRAETSERVKDAYQNDLARLRAEFDRRLRAKAAPAQGAAGGAGSPAVPGPAEGADGTASVCVPAEDILRGAETELRLLHLQRWITEQLKIPQ